MTTRIDYADPHEAKTIASMVGELLQEIMVAIGEPAFGFHQEETAARAVSEARAPGRWLGVDSFLAGVINMQRGNAHGCAVLHRSCNPRGSPDA
jgi:hypothetical protein